jgi:hypothetical protein
LVGIPTCFGVRVEKGENDGFGCFWLILSFLGVLLNWYFHNSASWLKYSGDILRAEFRSFEKKTSVFVLVFCLSAQSGEACFWDSHEKNDHGFV